MLRENKNLRTIAVLLIVYNLILHTLRNTLPPLINKNLLGNSVALLGYLNASFYLGLFLSYLLTTSPKWRERFPKARLLRWTFLASLILPLLYFSGYRTWAQMLSLGTLGFLLGPSAYILKSEFQQEALQNHPRQAGGLMGIYISLTMAAGLAGNLALLFLTQNLPQAWSSSGPQALLYFALGSAVLGLSFLWLPQRLSPKAPKEAPPRVPGDSAQGRQPTFPDPPRPSPILPENTLW